MNPFMLMQNGFLAENGKTVETEPLVLLSRPLEIEEGSTLRTFFRMLEHYPVLARLNMYSDSFLAQYRSCPGSYCVVDGIDHVELGKTVEMIGFPGEPGIEIYMTLYGVNNGKPVEIKDFWLQNLLDMDLKFGKLKHVIFGDKMDVFEFDTVFTLFELIDGISWQLSFHNMPAECRVRIGKQGK